MTDVKKQRLVQAFKIIGFFAAIVAVNAVLYFGMRPRSIPGPTRAFRTYELNRVFSERENSIDVVYVGHSSVYFGVSPMEIYDKYGIAGYDYSQALMLPWETYLCLVDLYEKQCPKLVMLEVDQFFYDDFGFMFNSFAKRVTLSVFPFYESHLYWRNGFGAPPRDPNKAYAKRDAIVPFDGEYDYTPTDEVYEMHELHKKYLYKIVELCREKGSEVAFFEIPTHFKYSYAKHNCAQKYADEFGVKFLDLNNVDVGLDWSKDTCDGGNHLNYAGAFKVSEYLGEWIEGNFELPDRRNDEAYADWNDDLVEYKRNVSGE